MSCGYIGSGLHNKATKCQAKRDPLSLDVYEKLAELKREFIKYCKPFEARHCKNVPSHRVIVQGEEQSTDIMILRFIVDKNACSSTTMILILLEGR